MADFKFMGATSAAHKRNIPYGTVVGHLQQDPRDSGRYVPLVSFQDFASSVVNIRADNSGIYQNTACVDLGALFRPFSCTTNPEDYGDYYLSSLPRYREPHPGLASGSYPVSGLYTPPCLSNYVTNPFTSGNSYEWMTYGLDYSGIHLGKNPEVDFGLARGIGLNYPLTIVGYGADLQGYPIPNIVPGDPSYTQCSGYYADNYLKDVSKHVAGTLDLMYDRIRQRWCAPGMALFGVLAEDLEAGYVARASGALFELRTENSDFDEIPLYVGNTGETWKIRVFGNYSATVAAGTKGYVGYDPLTNKWKLISADCGGS